MNLEQCSAEVVLKDKLHSALMGGVGCQAAHRFAPIAKKVLANIPGNPYTSAASAALGALGYGQPNQKALENRVAS